jgi:hypothetical protein
MKKFEYKLLDVPTRLSWFGGKIDMQELTNSLNLYGKQGWEVINTTDTNWYSGGTRGLVIILKRELTT